MLNTLHRQVLKGLHVVSVRAQLTAEGCDGSFFPILKTKMEKMIEELLTRNGLQVDRQASAQLVTEVRTRVLNQQLDMVVGTAKIETSLREPVTIGRNGLQAIVDTWRHLSVIGVYSGVPQVSEISQLIENEAARQVETFLSDCQLNGSATHSLDELVDVASPRVTKAKELLAAGANYPKGCSEFVSAVLGITWENANSLMGDTPTLKGDNNNYPGLVPGDVVGWKVGGGEGHVAIYIGEAGSKFIDVRSTGDKPRNVINGYGSGRPLFKSSKY